MERMGHPSSRAALIYLHSTDDRQRTPRRDRLPSEPSGDLAGESGGTRVARDGQTDDSEQPSIRGRDPPDLR